MELINHINSFCNEYKKNPFQYIYEADLQIGLASFLKEHFKDESHWVESLRPHNYDSIKNYTRFNIGKVHREYPAKKPFDIAILGEPMNKSHDKPYNWESFYHQPIKYVIELKFIQLYQNGAIFADNSRNDYKKMFDKVDKLPNANRNEIASAFHITFFQSIEDQNEYLSYHDPKIYGEKWPNLFVELENFQKEHSRFKYLICCMKDFNLKEIRIINQQLKIESLKTHNL